MNLFKLLPLEIKENINLYLINYEIPHKGRWSRALRDIHKFCLGKYKIINKNSVKLFLEIGYSCWNIKRWTNCNKPKDIFNYENIKYFHNGGHHPLGDLKYKENVNNNVFRCVYYNDYDKSNAGIRIYEGELYNNRPQGIGKLIIPGYDLIYEGEFYNGHKHGYGREFKCNHMWYVGIWKYNISKINPIVRVQGYWRKSKDHKTQRKKKHERIKNIY